MQRANAGFSANIVIAGTDVLLASITSETAKIIDPAIEVSPLVNYYFMAISTILLALVGTFVTTRIVEKIAGDYERPLEEISEEAQFGVSEIESKGLRGAGIFSIIYWGLIILALIPTASPLRGAGGSIISSPFIKGIVPLILFWFIGLGTIYGKAVGVIKNSADVPKLMSKAIEGMSGYIVLVFVMAQFISFFNWTNMGLILSVKLADLLKAANFTGRISYWRLYNKCDYTPESIFCNRLGLHAKVQERCGHW